MKHLLSTADLDRTKVEELMTLADSFAEVQRRDVPKVPALRGRTVVLAFFEDSTRTRTSFDLAARRLSADVVTFSVASSATKKGESLRDTVETINAMGIDAIVVRHRSSGAPVQIARWAAELNSDASVVNAGDGWHQHPTQALLDAYTIRARLGGLDGARVAICGDINHSRVARSNVDLFTKLGAEVTLVGPQTLMPADCSRWPVSVSHDLDSVIPELDVIYMLRIQQERLSAGLFPTVREYRASWGLTEQRAQALPDNALIMHPGPMNRGVEIDPVVADDSRSVIRDQVAAGIPVRMAVLYQLLGPGRFGSESDAGPIDQQAKPDGQTTVAASPDAAPPTASRESPGVVTEHEAIARDREVSCPS